MITDLLFYTISTVQIYFLVCVVLGIYGISSNARYMNISVTAEQNVKDIFECLICDVVKLILITTVKPYFLAMIGNLA